jgi:uncharacterized protein YndB with AHSA1/START domain
MATGIQARSDDARVLRLSRTFEAPRERVFRALTERDQLARWFGPKGYTVPYCELDARVGGAWRATLRSPEGGDHTVSGVYQEIVPPQRLVFTWGWHGDDGTRGHETIVTLELHARGAATELVLVQQLFETAESCGHHEAGWSSSLECLADALGSGELG